MKTAVINTSSLPFFRFFAACVVVFFHFGQKIEFYPQVPAIFKTGSLMVTFFFVLSGFVLFLGYHQKERVSWLHYFCKRAIRILPLYFLAFFLSAGFLALSGQLSWLEFVLNFFCLQSWFPQPLSLNFTSWFVSDLLFFYCVFPFILFFLKKIQPSGTTMMMVGLSVWAMTQGLLIKLLNTDFYTGYPSWSYDLIYYFPLSHFCSFFMGICGAYYVRMSDLRAQQGGVVSLLTTVIIFSAVGVMVQLQPELVKLVGFKIPFASSFYAPIVLLLIFHLTLTHNPLLKMLSWQRFVLWGEMSYALFILQAPMDRLYKYVSPEYGIMHPGISFVLFFVVLISVAFLVTLVEKPIVRRLKISV